MPAPCWCSARYSCTSASRWTKAKFAGQRSFGIPISSIRMPSSAVGQAGCLMETLSKRIIRSSWSISLRLLNATQVTFRCDREQQTIFNFLIHNEAVGAFQKLANRGLRTVARPPRTVAEVTVQHVLHDRIEHHQIASAGHER